MTTLVMVERDGVGCMAADSLLSSGGQKESARYVANAEKILEVGTAYLGFVGWAAHQNVIESVLANGLELPDVACERDLFEFARDLHGHLKEDYFLKTEENSWDAYESTQMSLLLLNPNGMFSLFSDRSVLRYRRFTASGSGSAYALGAMFAAYAQGLPAEEVARLGVLAGAEFDRNSGAPVTMRRVLLKDRAAAGAR